MSSGDKAKNSEEITLTFKLLEKDARKHFIPTRAVMLKLIVLSVIIALVSSAHGLNEAWAWKVAELLITIDGLVLGFAILGMTILLSRESSEVVRKSMVEESVNDMRQFASSMNKSCLDGRPELLALTIRPIMRLKLLRTSFVLSTEFLLTSIGLAFCLFGVSDGTTGSPLGNAFLCLYSASIGVFVMGVYILMKALSFLMEKIPISLDDTLDSTVKILEQGKMPEKEGQTGKK